MSDIDNPYPHPSPHAYPCDYRFELDRMMSERSFSGWTCLEHSEHVCSPSVGNFIIPTDIVPHRLGFQSSQLTHIFQGGGSTSKQWLGWDASGGPGMQGLQVRPETGRQLWPGWRAPDVLRTRRDGNGEGEYIIYIWSFPEMGVPLNHPFYRIFHYKTIHLGVPPFMETPIYIYTYIHTYIHNHT